MTLNMFDLVFVEWIRSRGTTIVYIACHISRGYLYLKAITTKDSVVTNTKRNGRTDTYSRPPKSLPSRHPIDYES